MAMESGQVIAVDFAAEAREGAGFVVIDSPEEEAALDAEIAAGIASIFASMDESDIRSVDGEDTDDADDAPMAGDVTYQLLSELNRLWLAA